MPLNTKRTRLDDTGLPCESVTPDGGYTRTSCGRLWYSAVGNHNPADFPIDKTYEVLTAVTWGDGNIGFVHNPGGRQGPSDFSGRASRGGQTRFWLPRVAPRRSGFMQLNVGQTGYGDCHVGAVMRGLDGFAQARWLLYTAAPGNISNNHSATDAGGGSFQMTNTGACRFGLEVYEGTREVRAFHDALNGDPREDRLGGFYPAITSLGLNNPFSFCIESDNGQNGFEVAGGINDVAIMKRRAIRLEGLPNAGSVRISVNGAVVMHAGPVNYINAVAGVVTWDPAPFIFFPNVTRYEIFNAAALGGALVSDLTVPVTFGGDVIGPVPA